MRILIFSDTHLTHKFDTELFDYIAKLVKSADQVIINGDFWDAYLTTFTDFINSEWNKLFPLLKEKDTVYVIGNHDKRKCTDDRYKLFANSLVEKHSFQSGKITVNIQHGHLIAPTHDHIWLFSNPNYIRPFYIFFIFLINTYSFFGNFYRQEIEAKVNSKQLASFKEYVSKNFKTMNYYVFGHSHIKHFDEKINLISCAFTKKAFYSYCIVENGTVKLQELQQA